MSQPERNDLFQGWNISEPEDNPPPGSDLTRSWPGTPRRPLKPDPNWDEPRPLARSPWPIPTFDRSRRNPAADFTLHPHLDESDPDDLATGATVGGLDRESNDLDKPIPFPNCGEGIGGFRLVSELGRGAFGRVYLAEEAGLGNRPVALKVTRAEGEEPRLLARLQHTHIVPIHSVTDDPETGLRLMCMPYFGGANLSQVLEATGQGGRVTSAATGLSLIEALDIVGNPATREADRPSTASRRRRNPLSSPSDDLNAPAMDGSSVPLRSILRRIPWWSRSFTTPPTAAVEDHDPAEPARRFLRESSFVRASAWIAARLAEGLEHAHSRGLLHRDLKPSNILIAADGTPMLLDFNLAADCVATGEGDRARIGGTLPYMAPEHLDAFNPNGTTPPEAVDERSDIYALGLILFEMIAGEHPFPEPAPGRSILEVVRIMTEERRGPAPSPRRFNPEVPKGLDAIVRKCLDPDPDRRHAKAGDLAEDLRRFLDDRPLKYTREPSLTERAAKWARRNPRISGATPIAILSIALILMVGVASWSLSHHFQIVSARLKLRVFERSFLECQFLLNIANGPAKNLGRGIGMAEEAVKEAGVNARGDGFRSWLSALSPEEQETMRTDLAELLLLVSRARVYQAERSKSEEKRRRALDEGIVGLNRAEQLDPHPPQALYAERARYHSALGQAREAAADRARYEATPPSTGRDYYLIGTSLLGQQQPDRAETALLKAVGLDPRRFWGWFSLGLCHFDQGRFTESAGDFAVCAVLAPRFAWPWMNRGLALARAGRLIEARESYNRAIEADPRNAEALAYRGLTALELNDTAMALDDLEKALALGIKDSSIRAAMGEALARSGKVEEGLRWLDDLVAAEPGATLALVTRGMLRLGLDPNRAEADFRQVLSTEPRHPIANLGMARRLRVLDPAEALKFADLAVSGDPNRIDALELRAWLRGRLGDPLAIADVNLLIRTPTPNRLYNAACALALLSESQQADPNLRVQVIDLLRRAVESGFPTKLLKDDPDLQSLRADPTFRGWVERPE